jgi:hypothetical protein
MLVLHAGFSTNRLVIWAESPSAETDSQANENPRQGRPKTTLRNFPLTLGANASPRSCPMSYTTFVTPTTSATTVSSGCRR